MARAFGDIAKRALRTATGQAVSRAGLIKAVHAAARAACISSDDRHALQLELTGTSSLADMSLGQLGKMLDHFNRKAPARKPANPLASKIKALWWSCYWLGAIDTPEEAALNAFVERQSGLSHIRFVNHRQAPSIIEALKAMAARETVIWPTEKACADASIDQALADRHAVLRAIWDKLREAGSVRVGTYALYYCAKPGTNANHWSWSAAELDGFIRDAGKKLRRALSKPIHDA